ncbi:MAG TPA: FHA domain-containing protein [Planctomycetota bacterium]|nr:FHA domain-containing protein [Planctomycetota bacterium]
MSCLVVTSGRAKGRTFKITPDREAVVGRVSECDVCIADPHISRRHCVIAAGQTGYFVRDLGSANGVAINGAKISAEAPLKDGDKLMLGKVEIEFHQEERFEDAETKKLAAAAAAAAASPQIPPRKRSARIETQAVVEFCARCSGSVPAAAIKSGKARRGPDGLLCPECLAGDAARADAGAARRRPAAPGPNAEVTEFSAGPKRGAAGPAPAIDDVIPLDDDDLPVLPDDPPPSAPKAAAADATTPIPGKRPS